MGWTIPTYAGTYMGGSPSAARVALFELCRAVNERQAATATTKTQFYKADGSLASDVALVDLAGIRASGTACNAFLNLKKVRDAVVAMLDGGYFLQPASGMTVLTKAALETAISADLDADPIRPQEARFWQAMQDALDNMTCILRYCESGAPYNYTLYKSGNYSTAQDAWDNRTQLTTGFGIGPKWTLSTPGANYVYEYTPSVDYDYNLSAFVGTVYGGAFRITYNNDLAYDAAASFGIASITIPASTNAPNTWAEYTGALFTLGSTQSATFQITTTEPGTTPFTADGNLGMAALGDTSNRSKVRLYIDLASVLSDQ